MVLHPKTLDAAMSPHKTFANDDEQPCAAPFLWAGSRSDFSCCSLPTYKLEESVRLFPTLFSLVGKMLCGSDRRNPFKLDDEEFSADRGGHGFAFSLQTITNGVAGFDESLLFIMRASIFVHGCGKTAFGFLPALNCG
jgi:hypothetical protein